MMKSLFEKKILIGIFFGMIISLLFYIFWDNVILTKRENKFIIPIDTAQAKGLINKEIIDKPITRIFQLDEEITSFNQRLDDLYILGGIIIALLLAINIGVYIKAEAEIEKHFKDSFSKYKEQVINCVNEAESLIKKAQTELDLISKQVRSIKADKKI